MALRGDVANEHIVEGRRNLVGHNVGEEAQPAHVDTDDGYVLVAYTGGYMEQCAIAAHRHRVVGAEIIAREDPVGLQVDAQLVADKPQIGLVYEDSGVAPREGVKQRPHCHRLAHLVTVAEKRKT